MGSFLPPVGPFVVKRIAIIGGGPVGIATAKYLLAENAFDKIDIFEQQSQVGGVWNYTPNVVGPTIVPHTDPHEPPEPPIWPKGAPAPLFSNPMYDHLNTNIPKDLMQFSDQEFSSESLLYPSREDVQDYLVKYSQDIRHLVQFSTQVEDVQLVDENGHHHWNLTSNSTVTGQTMKQEYDAIVVANGHYSVPYIPPVSGMKLFNSAYPSIITHSKIYRSPKSFANKKVIVVGNAPSGLDIGTQISQLCRKPLLNSVRSLSPLKSGKGDKEEVPCIAEFLVEERGVRFEDGRIEKDIDAIVYCTGYLYSYPFLKTLDPSIVTTGRRVIGLYRQVFNINHPTLAFTCLQKKIIPFPLSEVQAAAIAKVWANKLHLLKKEEMELLEKAQLQEQGDGTNFHVLGYPKDAEYINDLHDWVGTSKDGFAKEPAFWREKERWMREKNAELRKKFVDDGERAKFAQELGYIYTRESK